MNTKRHSTPDSPHWSPVTRHSSLVTSHSALCIVHYALCIAALAACAAGAAADVEFWSVPAFSSVRRLADTYPADGEKGGAVEYIVTPGEHTGGSFVLRPDADVKAATLTAEGDFSEAMDPYVVKLWYQGGSAWYGFFADTASRKLVPELLLHDEIAFEVAGAGRLEAVANGDPRCLTPFGSPRLAAFNGMAVAVVRASGERGAIRLSAKAAGLRAAEASLVR